MRWGCSKRLLHVGSGSFGNQLRLAPCPSGILDHAPLSSSYHVSHVQLGPMQMVLAHGESMPTLWPAPIMSRVMPKLPPAVVFLYGIGDVLCSNAFAS